MKSEFDFLKGNLTIYHVDKTIRESGEIIDDGLHEIFVNTAVNDGSDIAKLMSCFITKEVQNKQFPAVTRRFNELKSEGGVSAVCDIMEKYLQEGIRKERIATIRNLIKEGFSKEVILRLEYTEEEYAMAEEKEQIE